MGGSRSRSRSNSTSRTSTSTQNLSLDGVEGVTVAGSESVTVNMTDAGAFDLVGEALQVLEASQAAALTAVSDNSSNNLDALTKATLGSFEKINESNLSDSAMTMDRITQISTAGLAIWGIAKIWGKK
ncbi:MAG: hypothetical protein COA83_09900 [Methylophaga sp.]|nr:MAG: hypothetical protein COA83_09900 [Methylophaga sp.]